jgi:FAD/FMN-containing dehydrogenase/Fe-S oxidoreductase
MPDSDYNRLRKELEDAVAGEVRFDRLSRALYATDASIYEIVPAGVVMPRSIDDVSAIVKICRSHRMSMTPRGAGTGLTGGAVGPGVQIDFARHLNQVLHVDVEKQTVRVQPGVVLDELNAMLAPTGLHFAVDVATSSRATIGGMVANNSCGARSILYGRSVDHVLEMTTVMADGTVAVWDTRGLVRPGGTGTTNGRATAGAEELARVRKQYRNEVVARFPKVLRSNGGYGLDRLVAAAPELNPVSVLSGSEGTLCFITECLLNLTPLPRAKALLVIHYAELMDALASVPPILERRPAAIELVDRMIIQAARSNPAMAERSRFIEGDPSALLVVEYFGDTPDELARRISEIEAELKADGRPYACVRLDDATRQADMWEVRKAGLGLLMSRPGDLQPYAFIEDASVDAARLHDYIHRLNELLRECGIEEVGHYAHASVGCLHVRPVLNLKKAADIERMRRIADGVSSLVVEFGGTMTGEHGDGIVRSTWLEKLYGPTVLQAFREIKDVFDPDRLMNPGKIVDPYPMVENLRYGDGFTTTDVKTFLDFDAYRSLDGGDSGMAGLAAMCSGVGQCRQRLVGTMCPSYRATGDEMHTTRARANALRLALSDRTLIRGLDDPVVGDVLDLCLSCKACKTECPTGVDIGKLKAEYLSYRNQRVGASQRSRMVADSVRLAKWGSRLAPLSNWIIQSLPVRILMEKRFGFDRRVPPPAYTRRTFRHWMRKHERETTDRHAPRGPVVYFCDTWTNHHTPNVGIAVVQLLEAAGFRVVVPETECCGRPQISKGFLAEAQGMAERNVARLIEYADLRTPIVGSEPSCVSTLVDEYPQFVRTDDARRVAACTQTVENFLARLLRDEPGALRFDHRKLKLLYHGHCHQKALFGTTDAVALLNTVPGFDASEIPSGCCGMAGAFGHEVEHYDVAKAVGEDVLFPAVRERGDAQIAVSGFSCRHQVEHHTGAPVRHLVEFLADAVARER